ncbi:MAG: hypothetical protein ACK5PW_07650 [Burkholderiales bacterium]
MKSIAKRPSVPVASASNAHARSFVTMGAGVIFPHVDRHLRGQRRDGDRATVPGTPAPARVSVGSGVVFPAVAVHVKRVRSTGR